MKILMLIHEILHLNKIYNPQPARPECSPKLYAKENVSKGLSFSAILRYNPTGHSGRAEWGNTYFLLFLLISPFSASLTHPTPKLLDFSTIDTSNTTKELVVTFVVPEKDCIYKDFITCSMHEPEITLSLWKADKETVSHYDSSFKETKPAFNETFSIAMTATTTKNPITGHLYCSYYRGSEKRINHALFAFSFPEISPDVQINESESDRDNENNGHTRATASHTFYLDDYFRTILSTLKRCVYTFTSDYKNYIVALIFFIILLFSVSYVCRKQLLQYTKTKELLDVTIATLLIVCGASLVVRFYTTQNALVFLILSCMSSFITGLLYIKKSTELVYKPLRTFCSCMGIFLIISSLLLAFKALQCADEKFDLFL
jgi:hypothetical protein